MTFAQPVVPRLHASIDRAFGLSDRVEGDAQPCDFQLAQTSTAPIQKDSVYMVASKSLA